MGRIVPTDIPEDDRARIVERPDGFYWQSEDRRKEYGPFESLRATIEDMQAVGETDYEPGESIAEAEAELGMADWIDPDTGEPAEESIPRTEDH